MANDPYIAISQDADCPNQQFGFGRGTRLEGQKVKL